MYREHHKLIRHCKSMIVWHGDLPTFATHTRFFCHLCLLPSWGPVLAHAQHTTGVTIVGGEFCHKTIHSNNHGHDNFVNTIWRSTPVLLVRQRIFIQIPTSCCLKTNFITLYVNDSLYLLAIDIIHLAHNTSTVYTCNPTHVEDKLLLFSFLFACLF